MRLRRLQASAEVLLAHLAARASAPPAPLLRLATAAAGAAAASTAVDEASFSPLASSAAPVTPALARRREIPATAPASSAAAALDPRRGAASLDVWLPGSGAVITIRGSGARYALLSASTAKAIGAGSSGGGGGGALELLLPLERLTASALLAAADRSSPKAPETQQPAVAASGIAAAPEQQLAEALRMLAPPSCRLRIFFPWPAAAGTDASIAALAALPAAGGARGAAAATRLLVLDARSAIEVVRGEGVDDCGG